MAPPTSSHVFRRGNRQENCMLCCTPARRCDPLDLCKIAAPMRTWLKSFMLSHGRLWKSRMRLAWENGEANEHLQAIRNTLGPSWLAKVDTTSLKQALDLFSPPA